MIMSVSVWICPNLPKYAWIWLNLPEWPSFCISPFPNLFYNPLSTWKLGYLFERLTFKFAATFRGLVLGGGGWRGRESWYTLFCFLIYPLLSFVFSQSKLVKKSCKSYPIFVKLLTFNRVSVKCECNNFRVASCNSGNLRVVSYNSSSPWVASCEMLVNNQAESRESYKCALY